MSNNLKFLEISGAYTLRKIFIFEKAISLRKKDDFSSSKLQNDIERNF